MKHPPEIMSCIAIAAAILFAHAGMADSGQKTPVEWVAQLGAGHLAERDEASAALLAMGADARDAVKGALDSSDAEVKARAQDLWETLRWDVIPGAEQDIAVMVALVQKDRAASQGDITTDDYAAWRKFVKAHGAKSLLLVAEFHNAGYAPKFYKAGMGLLLKTVPPRRIAGVILNAGTGPQRDALEAPLGEFAPAEFDSKAWAGIVGVRNELGEYDKAFDFGRAAGTLPGYDRDKGLDAACARAVERGGMFDKVKSAAPGEITSGKDANQLCASLAFYVELMTALHKDGEIPALCAAATGADVADAGYTNLPRLVDGLAEAGQPGLAVKLLRNAKSPLHLYVRSHAEAAMKDDKAADADWRQAQAAADAIAKDDDKKEACFNMADQMADWGDPKAEALFRKILTMPPHDDVWDANASMRLASICEDKKEYAQAADFYEKGLSISSGALIVTVNDEAVDSPKDWVEKKIAELRAKASAAKNDPGAARPERETPPAPGKP